MKTLYRILLTINATSWVVMIYGIKEEWTLGVMRLGYLVLCYCSSPFFLSAMSIWLTLPLSKDTLEKCSHIEEANNSFLPTYLGYFFVGLGVEKVQHLAFVYLIIFVFTYVAQIQYFNPIFLLFGYRFYNAETGKGTKVFLIVKKEFRRASDASFRNLRRINNTTFIAWREKDESTNSENT